MVPSILSLRPLRVLVVAVIKWGREPDFNIPDDGDLGNNERHPGEKHEWDREERRCECDSPKVPWVLGMGCGVALSVMRAAVLEDMEFARWQSIWYLEISIVVLVCPHIGHSVMGETKQYLWCRSTAAFPMMPRRARCPEGPRMAPEHRLCVHRVLCVFCILSAFIMIRCKKNQGQRRKLFTQGSLASQWGARIQAHASCLPGCTPESN